MNNYFILTPKVLGLLLLWLLQKHHISAAISRVSVGGRSRDLETDAADPIPDPIVVPLVPFEVSLKGSAVQDEDVDTVLEQYLFQQLSVVFPPLAAVLLAHNVEPATTRRRRLSLLHNTYFSAGAGIFLDPDNVPTDEDFQAAQETALEDLLELQRFVNLERYYWLVEPVAIGEQEIEEEVEVEESDLGINGLQEGPVAVETDNKNKTISIVMLALGGCLLVVGVSLATRKVNNILREKPEPSSFQLERKVDMPTARKIDMCGVIEKRVPSSTPPRRACSQLSSQDIETTLDGEIEVENLFILGR
jgi:hypothetical protein